MACLNYNNNYIDNKAEFLKRLRWYKPASTHKNILLGTTTTTKNNKPTKGVISIKGTSFYLFSENDMKLLIWEINYSFELDMYISILCM